VAISDQKRLMAGHQEEGPAVASLLLSKLAASRRPFAFPLLGAQRLLAHHQPAFSASSRSA
jgi:hypothetical protein